MFVSGRCTLLFCSSTAFARPKSSSLTTPSVVTFPDLTQSPTLSLGATMAGVIIGTAAYMSPEQASGNTADRRADIWSFGAVLYELLAGRQAFAGDSISDTLASVLKVEPDWTRARALAMAN